MNRRKFIQNTAGLAAFAVVPVAGVGEELAVDSKLSGEAIIGIDPSIGSRDFSFSFWVEKDDKGHPVDIHVTEISCFDSPAIVDNEWYEAIVKIP